VRLQFHQVDPLAAPVVAQQGQRRHRGQRQHVPPRPPERPGPDPDRSAVIRANAALAVVKGATVDALELAGDTLDPSDREEILHLALATLRGPAA
jgi:hypothetical protein